MKPAADKAKPLVIITSNVERQLPDAFLRRCVFFYIPFPDDARLFKILEAHFPDVKAPFLGSSISVLKELRRQSMRLTKRPATAELINWVGALRTVFERDAIEKLLKAADKNIKAEESVDWRSLPALGCLLKLREDFDQVLKTG